MFRFAKVLILLVAALFLPFGSALALDYSSPYAQINHISHAEIVGLRTDYKPTEAEAHQPEFRTSSILVLNAPMNTSGLLNLNASEKIWVGYWRPETGESISEEEFNGEKTFYLWKRAANDNHFAGNADGVEAEFGKVAEDIPALSNQPFSFVIGTTTLNSFFPTIRTTKEQLENKCVPYLELLTDDNMENLIAVKWRFVDPANPSAALIKDSKKRSISRVTRMDFRRNDNGRSTTTEQLEIKFSIGEAMEGTLNLTKPIKISEIQSIRPYFRYDDSVGNQAQIEYSWRFYVSGTITPPGPTDPTQPQPGKPSDTEVENARNAANENLTEAPAEVIAANQTDITTGTNVTFSDGEITKQKTSSVIAISQTVQDGGAVVLGTELTMPINSKSLSGLDLPKPTDFNDLQEKYNVIKYFEGGGHLNLLDVFGSKIFRYSEKTGVTLIATIVILDGPAPVGDLGIIRPPSGDRKYGAKLSSDNKYLYIYDGVKDGVAKDPIALVKTGSDPAPDPNPDDPNPTPGTSGSSSGCNAGFGIALLIIFAAPLIYRKK